MRRPAGGSRDLWLGIAPQMRIRKDKADPIPDAFFTLAPDGNAESGTPPSRLCPGTSLHGAPADHPVHCRLVPAACIGRRLTPPLPLWPWHWLGAAAFRPGRRMHSRSLPASRHALFQPRIIAGGCSRAPSPHRTPGIAGSGELYPRCRDGEGEGGRGGCGRAHLDRAQSLCRRM